jgi:hypothetical protein
MPKRFVKDSLGGLEDVVLDVDFITGRGLLAQAADRQQQFHCQRVVAKVPMAQPVVVTDTPSRRPSVNKRFDPDELRVNAEVIVEAWCDARYSSLHLALGVGREHGTSKDDSPGNETNCK